MATLRRIESHGQIRDGTPYLCWTKDDHTDDWEVCWGDEGKLVYFENRWHDVGELSSYTEVYEIVTDAAG